MAQAALILVNYNTAAYSLDAVAALQAQDLSLEIIVVDNASRIEERERLRAVSADVRVIWSDTNLGYGGAINRALEVTQAPVVGFLNADTRPLVGAVKVLLGVLEQDARVGAAGPRAWCDDRRTFLLPPIRLPTLGGFFVQELGALLPGLGLARSRLLARWVWRVGYGDRVRFLPMLSGAFIFARREVLEKIGGFDPGFPLYFEDADWCRRVRCAGYRLAYVPAAEVVHYFDQSARQVSPQAELWRAQSLRHYVWKYYGTCGTVLLDWLSRMARLRPARLPGNIADLGILTVPPRMTLPRGTDALQLAYHWLFFDAVLGLVERAEWEFPRETWDRLRPGRYFLRALDHRSWQPLQVWTWEKA